MQLLASDKSNQPGINPNCIITGKIALSFKLKVDSDTIVKSP